MIGIITVNYNAYPQTKEFLESLARVEQNTQCSVYIADASNNKKDLSFNSPFRIHVEHIENKGYSHGINNGLRYFKKRGITQYCIVNNDIYFDSQFLVEVINSFKEYEIFGGKIYYAKGYEYHKNRYQKDDLGNVLWYAGGILDWNNVYTLHRGVDEVDTGRYNKAEKTEFITGCLICFNQNVVEKVGSWDEDYFLYYEDADYCERAKRKGFSLYYNPNIIIWHKNSQSTGGPGSKLHQKYQKSNRVRFGMKYAPLRTKLHLLAQNLGIIPFFFRL